MSVLPVAAKVTGDVGGFVSAMASGARSVTAFAGAAGLATGAIAGLAGAAAMGAAIRSAAEFEAELIKLNTLVGINIDQLEKWEGAMRGIAVQTGQSATEIARAMFAITSGGARGAEAMEILEQTAKASAIGLGDMTTIGRTTTAIMQTFGDTGLTASKAIDILVGTVREGNLEAGELAGAMSRVLGPAKALGAGMEDIGAFMATFTRLGGDSAQAATGLLNVFTLLIRPPERARKKLEELGVSVEYLRDVVRKDGLNVALTELNAALTGNLDALGEAIPNVRGLIGVLNTAGLQTEAYAEVQENLNNIQGATNESFETFSDTAQAAMDRFSSATADAGIALGEAFLPPLTLILKILQPFLTGLAAVVDVLDDMVRFAARDFGQGLMEFLKLAEPVDHMAESLAEAARRNRELAESLSEDELAGTMLSNQQAISFATRELAKMQEQVASQNNMPLWDAHMALMENNEAYKTLFNSRADYIEQNRVLMQKQQELAAVNRQLSEEEQAALAETTLLRQEAIDELLGSLQQELDLLQLGEQGILLQQAARLDETGAVQAQVAEMLKLIDATTAEQEARRAAMEAQIENKAERQSMIDALEAEIEALELSADEILLRRAAEIDASGATEERLKVLMEERDALIKQAAAEELAAGAIREATEERKEAAEAAKEALRESEANQELAELQSEMRQLEQVSETMAASFSDAFNDVADGTRTVVEAVEDMVTDILKELQRLAVQRFITDALAEAVFGALGGADTARIETGIAAPGVFDAPAIDPKTGLLPVKSSVSLPGVSSLTASSSFGPSTPQTVVQQTINLSPQLLDGADGARWLRQNGAEIMNIVGRGVQQSSQYGAMLRGTA